MEIDTRPKLYEDFTKGAITFLQFQQGIIQWLLSDECWKDFHPMPFPFKSDEVLEHEKMPAYQRKDLAKKYYDDHPTILKYYDKRLCIFETNRQRIADLAELIELAEDAKDYEKLKAKREEFKRVVAKQGAELNIKKYLYQNPEVRGAVDNFDGKVV